VEAVERLMLEEWPANVRDLNRFAKAIEPGAPLTQHAVERVLRLRAVKVEQGNLGQPKDLPVRPHDAPREAEAATGAVPTSAALSSPMPEEQALPARSLATQLQQYEAKLIEEAYLKARGNQSEAARQLGMRRRTMANKVKELGLRRPKR
jgi:DNA-binding NtrC family response regulator